MRDSNIHRRDFIVRASMLAVSATLFKPSRAGDTKYVIAETRFGKIRGIELRGIKIFKGIPYGASTAGKNRFMAPQDPAAWTGVRGALEYGLSAPQSMPKDLKPVTDSTADPEKNSTTTPTGPSIYTALNVPGNKPTGEGEDCLVLNIWTASLKDGKKRPVMLWLHGGGFGSGSGSNVGWDGTNLALRGDVTINHRLNVLGFANFSAFHKDFAASGDAGMLDIVHALKWVRDNIESFGGDPGRVMIFGQSGGGRKCETLLAMPSARRLFHRAAIESGVAILVADMEQATRNAEHLLEKLGISKNEVHKVQAVPMEQLMTAYFALAREMGRDQAVSGFVPTAGNLYLPQQPFHPGASAVSAEVPVIIGSTRTEWTGLTTDAALWHLDDAGMHLTDIYFLIISDYSYNVPTMKVTERRAALGKGEVYAYYFAWETPVQKGLLKSPHNLEWPFAFDNVQLNANLTGGGSLAQALADKVSDAWIAFAYTGNPNTPKLPHWPAFTIQNRATMVFNNECKVMNDPLREQRIAILKALDLV
jgi:para-nitrobenzyl esterase